MKQTSIVLATVVLVALSALTPAAAALDESPDEDPAVETSPATNVTATSATLNGNLTSLGGANNTSVWFAYWETDDAENATTDDPANATTTEPQQLGAPGAFDAEATGLANNTTYAYVAVAEAPDGENVTGAEVSFTTSAGGADDGGDDAFGQQVSAFVHEMQIALKSGDLEEPLGIVVSRFVLENNPGNAPEHAGPPDHAGPRVEDDDADDADDGDADRERGPPEHAGAPDHAGPPDEGDDDADAEEDETEGDDGKDGDDGEDGEDEEDGEDGDEDVEAGPGNGNARGNGNGR